MEVTHRAINIGRSTDIIIELVGSRDARSQVGIYSPKIYKIKVRPRGGGDINIWLIVTPKIPPAFRALCDLLRGTLLDPWRLPNWTLALGLIIPAALLVLLVRIVYLFD